jgi:MerR family copper efflux transcriptional regulator
MVQGLSWRHENDGIDPVKRLLTIGALAKRADVSADTIRFYEREGLLSSPERLASGYRQYDAVAVERLQFILRAKGLGFTLGEIKGLLALETDRENGVEGVRQRANERIADLDHRIAEMTRMRDALKSLADACPGSGEPEFCPILSALHGDNGAQGTTSSCCGEQHAAS